MANTKVVRSSKLSTAWEPRYVLVDAETGAVLDDAQGYGYKSAQNAYAAWGYKNRSPEKKSHDAAAKKAVLDFCREHGDIVDILEAGEFDRCKYGEGISKKEYEKFFRDMGFTDLPFTVSEFLKYRK